MIEPFRLLQEGFALRGEVLSQRWESTQRIAGGRVPAGFCSISGAQNLSGWSQFPPGHWALNCVGCNSTAAPSLAEQVIAGPSSSGRSGTGPYERRNNFCIRRRGGCPHLPVPSPWEPTPLMGRIIISLKGTAGKIRRRNAVSHQVLLVTFLPRKVTPPPGCNRC